MAHQNTRPKSLRLAFWNAESLTTKINELEDFIHREDIDVMLVNETHLSPRKTLKIPNYLSYRRDRDADGGGTAILVKNIIDHSAAEPIDGLQSVEANSVIVTMVNNTNLTITSVYASPARSFPMSDISKIFSANQGPIIAAGDYNAKHTVWNSRLCTTRGRNLHTYTSMNGLEVHGPDSPTHYPRRANFRPDVIDVAITRNVNVLNIHTIQDLSSDHVPVVVELNLEPNRQEPAEVQNTNWELFTETLNNKLGKLPALNTTKDVDNFVEHLTKSIHNAIKDCSRTVLRHPSNQLALPKHIQALIKKRNKTRKRWQRSRAEADKEEFDRLKYAVRTKIAKLKNERWQNTVESLDENLPTMWKISKLLRKNRSNNYPMHGERGLVYSNQEKAEALADSLEKQCTPVYDNVDLDRVNKINKYTRLTLSRDYSHEEIDFATPEEVLAITSKVNAKKASGPDGISNKAIRHLPRKAIVGLANIANALFKLGHFPASWKLAHVVPIPKPGKDLKFPQNHRPVSLLSNLSKVIERLLLTRIQRWSEANKVLPVEQHAYRKGLSTQHQLLRITEYITEGFNTRRATGAVFLDAAKAFDRVWQRGLQYKMIKKKYPIYLIKVVEAFLKNRKFKIRFGGCLSTQRRIDAGVPQGSTVAPELFNIYMNDLPVQPGVMKAQFADDAAYLYKSLRPAIITDRLQRQMDEMEDWCNSWRMSINPDKSTALLLTRRRLAPSGNISLFGKNIPWRRQYKYLGITLDRGLRWNLHTTDKRRSSWTAALRLMPLIGRNSKMSLANKLRLYKTIIRPQMLYGSSVWGHASKTQIRSIQAKQNRLLRIITNAPWYVRNDQLHRDLKISTIDTKIKETAEKFYATISDHSMPEIRALTEDYDSDTRLKYKRPRTLIF